MLLAAPPRPRTVESAGIQQIYVTHCLYDEGLVRQAGFGPRAGSTSDALLLRFAGEYPVYELPTGMSAEGLDPAAAPCRLALVRIPGGRSALVHSVYLPDDGRGRANNFFSHFLIAPNISAREALQSWTSKEWRRRWEEEGTVVPPRTELPRGEMLNDEAVTRFLQEKVDTDDVNPVATLFPRRLAKDAARRKELVRLVLHGCRLAIQARPGSPRSRFHLRAEPGLAALLMYAAARLLPEGLASLLTFSTYEDAHRTLRLYRQAAVVATYTPDSAKELDDDLFTTRGYALDTFTKRRSEELSGEGEPAVEQWIELAAEGEWQTIDRVQQLLGRNCTSLVSLPNAMAAARVAHRLVEGAATAEDLLLLRRSPLGEAILLEHKEQVWKVVRETGAGNQQLRTQFGAMLREHRTELEERVAAALRAIPPDNWRPQWQLLWSVLRHESGRISDVVQRVIPEPPFHTETRFGLLDALQHLPLSPADQRVLLPALLGGCDVEELRRFADTDLPRTWFAHALCHGVLRSETREHCVSVLHKGDDTLICALWEHFEHLVDEEQRRAILVPLFPPDEPQGPRFLSRFLRTGCTMRAATLEWLLDSLKAWNKAWSEFWSQEDHFGRLLEVLRGLGLDASPLWDQLFEQINASVLLPGSSYQQLMLMNLTAVRDRPGPSLPPAVIQAINDWVLLREHFEKATGVPESTRRALIDACNRRHLDPIAPMADYFERFVAPQGTHPEVVDDFIAFFHSFYLAGCEQQHYGSRLLGWLRVASTCADVDARAALQQHYLETQVPTEFRWQLADTTHRTGLLLPQVFERVPKPTGHAEEDHLDSPTRLALNDELIQLTGTLAGGDDYESPLLPSLSRRAPWLGAALVAGLGTVAFLGYLGGNPRRPTDVLFFVPALLLFVDAVTQQSVGLKVRRLRRGLPSLESIGQQLRGEFLCGLCLGIAGGAVLGASAGLWTRSGAMAIFLTIATALGSAVAAALGLAVPSILRGIPARPWMAAGPMARIPAALITLLILTVFARLFG
jgi:hypothetical protein